MKLSTARESHSVKTMFEMSFENDTVTNKTMPNCERMKDNEREREREIEGMRCDVWFSRLEMSSYNNAVWTKVIIGDTILACNLRNPPAFPFLFNYYDYLSAFKEGPSLVPFLTFLFVSWRNLLKEKKKNKNCFKSELQIMFYNWLRQISFYITILQQFIVIVVVCISFIWYLNT